ncbi:hypothetical protein FACS1894120_0080 [Clostridia bacterium]|nr:hypothetical protein FACS1894120_0080 [Clostridia bacterium]
MRILLHKYTNIKLDVIFHIVILFLFIFIATSCTSEQTATTAEISRNGVPVQTVQLDVDGVYNFEGYDGGYNIVTVKDGRISVSEADCPEQLCVNSGERGHGIHSRLPIVCLPHRIEIIVKYS